MSKNFSPDWYVWSWLEICKNILSQFKCRDVLPMVPCKVIFLPETLLKFGHLILAWDCKNFLKIFTPVESNFCRKTCPSLDIRYWLEIPKIFWKFLPQLSQIFAGKLALVWMSKGASRQISAQKFIPIWPPRILGCAYRPNFSTEKFAPV